MKKSVVAAVASALVIGAASTTFAASNPFSDVPQGHWAYDAVAQLAKDGVIEGYGDTTFQGDKNITRYEMAQMVAKAMAKTNVPSNDKALIDKLAAEFGDELKNLGVRVANLEKHSDNVKWNGKAEYTYKSNRIENDSQTSKDKTNSDKLLFRLEPSAEVNDHWSVNARLDATTYMDKDSGQDEDKDDSDVVYKNANSTSKAAFNNDKADVQGVTLQYDNPAASKLSGGVGYYHLQSNGFRGLTGNDYLNLGSKYQNGANNSDKASIWSANLGYKFDNVSRLSAAYAGNTEADNLNNSWQVLYNYKGAQSENKGTWGAYAGYRHLGTYTSLYGTEDAQIIGAKGWEVGADYAPFKNVVASAKYFDGKGIDSDRKAQTLWGRVSFLF
jgi:hypothetical protein